MARPSSGRIGLPATVWSVKWCKIRDSNPGRAPFQSAALPTELILREVEEGEGLEPFSGSHRCRLATGRPAPVGPALPKWCRHRESNPSSARRVVYSHPRLASPYLREKRGWDSNPRIDALQASAWPSLLPRLEVVHQVGFEPTLPKEPGSEPSASASSSHWCVKDVGPVYLRHMAQVPGR